MTIADQVTLTGLLAWLPIVVFALGGLWGIALVGRSPRRDRRDRSIALRLAGLLAIVSGGGAWLFIALIGSAWGGGSLASALMTVLPIGLGITALAFLSGVAGYAVLARPGTGAAALAGIVLGPLLLAGSSFATMNLRNAASSARYGFLDVSVDAVVPRAVEAGSVLGPVRLEVTVRSDLGFEWTTDEIGRTSPWFRARAQADPWALCEAKVWAPAGSPSRIEPGDEVHYSVEFVLPPSTGPEPCHWAAGDWWLDFAGTLLLDGDQARDGRIVQTQFQVP